MALFKPFRGSRVALDMHEKHDGYAYFCTDDGSFHIDYTDADGNLQRKQINAKDAETLTGMSLDEIKEYVASIQDVIDELPTENIDEKALYRLFKATFIHNRHIVDNSKCYIVDNKPEIGEPATNLERTTITAYYDLSDGEVYGYLDEALAYGFTQLAGTTITAGWYNAAQLLPIAGWNYAGVINKIGEDPNDSTIRLLLEKKVYTYQNEWIELTNSIVDEKLSTPERDGHFAYTVQRREGKDDYELHLISHTINEAYKDGELMYPYQIPLRENGIIKTAEPKEDLDAVNKKYADESYIPNMKRIDEAGLERAWYDAAALEKFQNKFNRVYVELSRNRGIYGKVALTASGKFSAQPVDFDVDDQEIPYYLGSIPTRLPGSEEDPDFDGADTRYRVGHIKVPPIDVDNFPTADEAKEFATSKLYVDTAIDKAIEENNNAENIYYTPNIDNRCITVTRDGKVDNKSTEVYINNNYKIDSNTSNYFKFTSNFKWNCTNNNGQLYFCMRDTGGLKGYIYLSPSSSTNTIITNGNVNTKLNLNSILPQDEWARVSIFGELGGMSYLKINDNVYELNSKAFLTPNADDIIYFTISVSSSFEGSASLSEIDYTVGTDAAINSVDYIATRIDISNYRPDAAIPKEKTKPVSSGNANYIWTTKARDDNDNFVVNKKFIKDALANPISPLLNKKIAYHGDSICESRVGNASYNGGGYAKIIADMTGCNYDNRAGSGSVLVSALPVGESLSNNTTAKYIVTDMDNMPDDADIICFQGGINDWFKKCPIGELSDKDDYSGELDTTTVIGALEAICRKAINKWPGKPICFVITHKIASGNAAYAKNYNGDDSWSYKELHDVMIQIFNKYSIPYLDMFNEGGLNSYIDIHNTLYFTSGSSGEPDKIHPNEEAYKKYYVPKLIKLFESLI